MNTDHSCGCGHDHGQHVHTHVHSESCGCGHDHAHHHHAHGASCGCGHDHGHQHKDYPIFQEGALNEVATGFMHLLSTHKFLPCARFVVRSSKEPDFTNVALAPVFIDDGEEEVMVLRAIGEVLTGLEHHEFISIDYDIPLENFDYSYFKESKAYKLFEQTVAEAKGKPGFLGDIADIEFGSIAAIG
jgi:ABC-type uncharacterized transport system, permease component